MHGRQRRSCGLAAGRSISGRPTGLASAPRPTSPFRRNLTPDREKLVTLLKEEGRFNEVKDLDIFALKRIVSERAWDSTLLEKLEPYQDTTVTESVRLSKRREEDE